MKDGLSDVNSNEDSEVAALTITSTTQLGDATGDTITQYGDLSTSGNCSCDWSSSSGTFKTSTGVNTFGGATVLSVTTKTADEDIDGNYYSFLELDGSSASVILTNLVAQKGQSIVITCSDSTNTTTVQTKTGTTLDGTNNKATFSNSGETLVLFAITATQYIIVENVGSVSLSSV